VRVLLTGIAGFIGHHVAEHIIDTTDWDIVGLASFRHKGCPLRLHEGNYDRDRVKVVYHDLRAPISERIAGEIGEVDVVYNLAADSHVDRSIEEPAACIENNVQVILNMLEWARVAKPRAFFQISTDEVYGPAPDGVSFREWASIVPSNPYSASKAMQESAAIAYWRTFAVPVILTNTMNNFGERQDPEKFIPKVMRAVSRGELVTIHGQNGRPGSRFYLHARNHADALIWLTEVAFPPGTVPMYPQHERPARFNVVGEQEVDNLAMARAIAAHIGKPLDFQVVDFHSSRPGHDLRYALNGEAIRGLGWRPPVPFEESLERTVRWTLAHEEWLR